MPFPGRCPGPQYFGSGTCSSVMVTKSLSVTFLPVGYPNALIGHPLPPLGVKIIFRVGLALLKCMLGTREKLKACQGQYETMELLRAIEPRYMQEGFLVREVKPAAALCPCDTKQHSHRSPVALGNRSLFVNCTLKLLMFRRL